MTAEKSTKRQRGPRVTDEARKARGIAMLLAGKPQDEIASECGVHLRTVGTWAADPEVRAAVVDMKAAAAITARAKLVAHASEAVDVLLTEMRTAESSGDRIRSALAVLDRTGHVPGVNIGIEDRRLPLTREQAIERLEGLHKRMSGGT